MSVDRTVILSQTITKVYAVLIEINHPLLPVPIRVINDDQDLVSLGYTWSRGYCSLVLPSTEQGDRRASITIQNVDNRIGLAAQQLIGPATVKFRIVRRDNPDIVEVEYPTLRISNIKGDASALAGTIVSNHDKSEPFPNVTTNKSTTPGLFL